jgi:hypothetical protein
VNALVAFKPVRVERPVPSARAKFKDPWVPFPEGQVVLREMARLLARADEGRPLNLALLADSGFGKSHLLDYFADSYPDLESPEEPCIQVLSLELPPEADGVRLLRTVLRGLYVDFSHRTPPDELLRKAIIHIKSLRVRLLVLDEIHNALGGRRDRAIGVVQTLRAISNQCRRPMVIAGTAKVDEVLRHDEQLDERFTKWRLPVWKNADALKPFLSAFEARLSLPTAGKLGTTPMADVVIELTKGRMGRIANLLRDAGAEALSKNHGEITPELLRACASRLVGRE